MSMQERLPDQAVRADLLDVVLSKVLAENRKSGRQRRPRVAGKRAPTSAPAATPKGLTWLFVDAASSPAAA